jgi:gliding motility-associated-like protein
LDICPQTTTTLSAQPGYAAYLWTNGGTAASISVNAGGTYGLTVTDANGCTGSTSAVVTQFTAPVPTIAGSTTICAGVPTTLDAGAGYAAYQWSPGGQTNAVITTAAAGTYQVTVTDANGCTGSTSATVIVAPNLTPTIAPNGPTNFCTGGSVTLNAGLFDNYLWSNNAVTSTIQVNASGTYSVQVTNNNGCTGSASIQIVVYALPTASINSPEVCAGNTALLTALALGGTAPYQYAWSNGLPNASSHTLAPATTTPYNVTITDGNGCTATAATVFTVNPNPVVDAGTDQSICNGATTSLQATVTSGTAPFSYTWTGGLPNTATPSVSPTDTTLYALTVTDANACTGTGQTTVNMAEAITVNAGTDQTICRNNTAALAANADGGVPPYTFAWSGGLLGANVSVSPQFTTTFTVTVTDALGCSATDAVTVNVVQALSVFVTTPNPSFCFNTNIPLNATPGFASYLWSTSETTPTIDAYQSAVYSVTVTDATGCSGTASISVTELQPVVVNGVVDNVDCAGGNDGSITVTGITGGIGTPASYQWSVPGQTGPVLDTLFVGTYTVTVTDGVGCTGSASYLVTEPGIPVGVQITGADATCAGLANGVAIANPYGGNPPYTFEWSNQLQNDTVWGLTPDVPYFVTVTDQGGCTASATVTVDDPTPIVLAVTGIQPTSCFNTADGSATVVASGGTPGYVFQWGNGETTATAVQLPAGTTSVLVGDALGCSATITATVAEPTPVSFNLVNVTAPDCNGTASGTARVTGTGGTAPYTYQWDVAAGFQTSPFAQNLSSGPYSVTVTDFNGCTGSGTILVPATSDLAVWLEQTFPILCFGDSTGAVEANPSGGTPPYTYEWSTGADSLSATLDSLVAGAYAVTVTDDGGCTASDSLVLDEPAELVLTVETDSVNCNGGNDGALILSATGGRLPYVFSRDSVNWQTGSVFPGLEADSFRLYVRDDYYCIDTADAEIFEPDSFLVTVTPLFDTIEFGETVQITATANHPAEWQWTNDTTLTCGDCPDPEAEPSLTTVYQLLATDPNGCEVEENVLVIVAFPRRVYVANLFTPNNDGANDLFLVQGGEGVAEVRNFRVFDRWGELVFEAANVMPNDPLGGWDGSFKGKAMNTGVFVWYAEVEFTDGFVQTIKGDVTLVR